MQKPPRYVPGRGFPAYAYIPGQAPHPTTDPRGHSYQIERRPGAPLHERAWHEHDEYLWGVDLYNHGYPWEAHEAWEGLWQLADRHTVERTLLQGLIQCAAAAVKALGGQRAGVGKLGASALQHLRTVIDVAGSPCLGVDLHAFVAAFERYLSAEPFVPEAWPGITLAPDLGPGLSPGWPRTARARPPSDR